MRFSVLAVIAAFSLTSVPAEARIETPSAAHQGQWWTNSLGCQYSRAGTPGATVWFLIANTAKRGCPTYINMNDRSGMYQAHGKRL